MLGQPRTREPLRAWQIISAAVVGLAAFWLFRALLPAGVAALNDDFGYLRSVLLTAAKGRPWTDDWLEPWAASLSVLSALVFKATGSFRLAVHGVQCVAFVSLALALLHLLRQRGQPMATAMLGAFALCLGPTLLWKSVEFTALVLYVPCLALAIGAATRERWGIFTVCACVALASRQSALAWFAIPAIAVLQAWRPAPREWLARSRGPLLAGVAGVVMWAGCKFGMNSTHARQVMTAATWETFQLKVMLGWLGFALLLGLVGIGAANGLRWLAAGFTQRDAARRALRPTWYGLLALALIITLLCRGAYADVLIEHHLYENAPAVYYLGGWIALAALGWIVGPVQLDLRLTGGALASALLVSLRPATWDYYWIDTALLAFFAVANQDAAAATSPATQPVSRRRRWLGQTAAAAVLVAMLGCSVTWVDRAKADLDDGWARSALFEQSLRAGKISPAQLAGAPFGFKGWHLYPYLITTREGTGANLARFQDYVSEGSVTLETRGADNPNPIPNPETVVGTGIYPIGWKRTKQQFILRRADGTAAPLAIDFARYRLQRFPLNDDEWRQAQ